jgi:BMFP domain-containing protein YqiC
MATRNKMLDDAARMAGGALGTLASLRREVEAQARQQFERLLSGLDLVTRDEFETVKAMAAKARAEQEALEKRLAALEKAAKPAKPATRRRRATKLD